MRQALLGLVVLFAQNAVASDRPTGMNCALREPPVQAGEGFNHGITLRIFPRAKDIQKNYTGCQTVWVSHPAKLEVLSVVAIERGHAVRVWSPHETDPARTRCRYREGKLIAGSGDHCPAPEFLIHKSMASGCVEKVSKSAAAGSAVFPEGCDFE